MLVRYVSPSGPMCLRCLKLTLSGPVEVLCLICFSVTWTCVVVSVMLVVCSLSVLCLTVLVNCLLNALAICVGEVNVFSLKVMVLFFGACVDCCDYEFSACIVCQVVRLYSVVEIVVMSGEVVCCSVVCGTLVGVSCV